MTDTISGFSHLNGNPAQARVTLVNVADNSIDGTTLSDPTTGAWAFSGLPAGRYEVVQMVEGYKARVDGPWVLSGYSPVPIDLEHVILPLTYDENDYHGLLAWERIGGDGPVPTPAGGRFDGLQTRLQATGLPAWASTANTPLYIGAQADILSVSTNITSGALPPLVGAYRSNDAMLSLAVIPDGNDSMVPNLAVSSDTGPNIYCGRPGWTYHGQYPEQTVNGEPAKPQALLFIDADTVLVSAHYNNTLSRFHLRNANTGETLGWFDMPQPHTHVASACFKSDGSLWMCDYNSGALMRVDLAASLASNTGVITLQYDLSEVAGRGAITWAMIDGKEYLISAAYVTSAVAPGRGIHVIPAEKVADGGTYSQNSDATRVYEYRKRAIQGVMYRSGKLYVASNELPNSDQYGGSINVHAFDLSLPDGAILPDPELAFIAPSRYVEDFDVRPGTNDLWIGTEGRASSADQVGFSGFWSAPVDGSGAPPQYISAFYDGTLSEYGSYTLRVRLNGFVFHEQMVGGMQAPDSLVIGGFPSASPGRSRHTNAIIRNVVIQPCEPTREQLDALEGGAYETRTLEAHVIPLVNLGAEDGLTGWTSEQGGVVNRNVAPPPHSGNSYFSGGSHPASKSRQRHNIESVTGLTPAQIDAGGLWARIEWWQAASASDGTPRDQATCGLRVLSSSNATLGESEGALDAPFDDFWIRRSHALEIPAGARSLDAIMRMHRNAGTVLQGNIDDIELTIYRQPE